MAVSCPEVMYGAYYPYLYGRTGPSRTFYQYERFNQDLYSTTAPPIAASSNTSGSSHSQCSPTLNTSTSSNPIDVAAIQNSSSNASPLVSILPGANRVERSESRLVQTKEEDVTSARGENDALIISHQSESSCSSAPDSPHQNIRTSSKDSTNAASQGRAQYISASCVVFTNYTGDTSSVVDEHFTKALNFSSKNSKENCSLLSRNLPPSFWNSNYVAPVTMSSHAQVSDLYSSEGNYTPDSWVPHAAHYGSYAHAAHAHAAHAHVYHHANMAQYGSLLRLPQQYGHGTRLHHDQQTALENAAVYSNYPGMAGLEAQESSKDLYWF